MAKEKGISEGGLPSLRGVSARTDIRRNGNRRNVFKVLCLVLTVLLLLPAAGRTYAQEKPVPPEVTKLLGSLKGPLPQVALAGEPEEQPRVGLSPEGYLVHLGAPQLRYFPVSATVPGDPTATARNFLLENRRLLGQDNPLVDYRPSARKSRAGRYTETYVQTYSGIPVFGATVNIQVNGAGGVEYLLARMSIKSWTKDGKTISVEPVFSSAQAAVVAEGKYSALYPGLSIVTTKPELNIYDPVIIGNSGPLSLVWAIEIYDKDKLEIHAKILVDAHNGQIADTISLRPTALEREIFDSANSRTAPTTPVRSDVNDPPGPNATGIAQVDNMYNFLGDSYSFYWNNHSRDGRDGDGGTMTAYVRWCPTDTSESCPYGNAHGGEPMVFGNGFVVDDVVGHEYTHFITGMESQLVYANNSGAINESFSDIWGEFIDLTNGRGTDTAAVRWLAGEDMPNGALRDMKNPSNNAHSWGTVKFSDPDRMSRYLSNSALTVEKWDGSYGWYGDGDGVCDAGETCIVMDSGGVHFNSGIGNKLAYLLTDGDTFNGYTIKGMGITAVADLFYEVQVNTLYNTPSADYMNLHWALRQAAVNLGWSTASKNNLYNACRAVEIVGYYWPVFISTAGNDSGAGSSSDPFRTVTKGNSAANPGDVLNIAPGTYDEPQLLFDKIMTIQRWQGTSGSVIIK